MTPSRTSTDAVVIRLAGAQDASALRRLAQLDAARLPAGDKLVAEIGGELVAAYGVEHGERIGDPFRPTAEVLDLLALRARARVPRARAA